MGYREDILANFDLTMPELTAANIKTFVEDLLIMRAIGALLQYHQNLWQNRYRATFEEYIALHSDVLQEDITLDDLDGIDPGIKEQHRKLYSFEQGTPSGKARDAIDKVNNELNKKIVAAMR